MSEVKKKVAVIGGGAAGMLAAGRIARGGCSVTLFERNSLLGKKLGITGKGRCNLTSDVPAEDFMKNVTKNGKFLFSAINRFSCRDTMDFFTSLGVKLKTERGGRVFPESDKAVDVVLALKKYVLDAGVSIKTERVTSLDAENGNITAITTEKNKYTGFDDVLLCTGGASYPLTGSTGDGYGIARALGHTVTEIMPSLVGLWSEDKLCRDTQGLSLKNVSIKVYDNAKNKAVYEDFGEMLFTHFGLSGPLILSASAHTRPMEKDRYTVFIDLKPALTVEQLDARVLSDFDKYKNKNFENSLVDLFPSKLIQPFIYMCGIEKGRKVNSITRAEREKIVSLIKALPIRISGFRPIDEAIVTSGGVKTSEIDPKTMRSKKVNNLYFAGEIIDVDAYTGGFNLQIAFSTAVTAADAIIGNE
ncbi:MAG: NAD(P)/FAD-dependent oxidoreductase [Clostridia bacterium]|nr:NAD(P)/FAD-dependent oxidoreductase [Clostridia bacterium]